MINLTIDRPTTDILNEIPSAIECGRHSGIPDCCIRWYVSVFIWFTRPQKDYFFATLNTYEKGFRHVPCPDCYHAGRIVEIKKCQCNAGGHEELISRLTRERDEARGVARAESYRADRIYVDADRLEVIEERRAIIAAWPAPETKGATSNDR